MIKLVSGARDGKEDEADAGDASTNAGYAVFGPNDATFLGSDTIRLPVTLEFTAVLKNAQSLQRNGRVLRSLPTTMPT